MRHASWILGALAAAALAGCGGGVNRERGTGETGDTTALVPGPAPMDTAMTGTGAAADTMADTTR